MTGLLQPADVSWMRPLKLKFRDRWHNWLINEPRSLTKHGNWRSPGYARAIDWIGEIWEELNPAIIANSFTVCGITQSDPRLLHKQLVAFMDQGVTDMVDDEDGGDEIDGFDDGACDEQLFASEDSDGETESDGESE
jgi:hypothetical protein